MRRLWVRASPGASVFIISGCFCYPPLSAKQVTQHAAGKSPSRRKVHSLCPWCDMITRLTGVVDNIALCPQHMNISFTLSSRFMSWKRFILLYMLFHLESHGDQQNLKWEAKKRMPRVRIELTTFRFLFGHLDYETDALPTALTEAARMSCDKCLLKPKHAQWTWSSQCAQRFLDFQLHLQTRGTSSLQY